VRRSTSNINRCVLGNRRNFEDHVGGKVGRSGDVVQQQWMINRPGLCKFLEPRAYSDVGRSKSSVTDNSGKVASHQPGRLLRRQAIQRLVNQSGRYAVALGLVAGANCVNYGVDACDVLTPWIITNKTCSCRFMLRKLPRSDLMAKLQIIPQRCQRVAT